MIFLKDIWDRICRRKRAKTYLVAFCSSNQVHFFRFSLRENQSFDNVNFFNSKCLTLLTKLFISLTELKNISCKHIIIERIPLLINLFFSLTELKTCKFKIDKRTYSINFSWTAAFKGLFFSFFTKFYNICKQILLR